MRGQQILTLMLNTIQKEVRNKTLIFLFVVGIMLIFLINASMDFVLNPMAKYQLFLPGLMEKKIVVFYVIISVWGGLLASILGVNCVRSDFEHNVFIQLLSFPIKRSDYLGARILGTWFIVLGYYVFSLSLAFLIFAFTNKDVGLGLHIPLAIMVNSMSLLCSIIIAVFLSFFFNKLLSLLGVIFVTTVINMSNSIFMYRDSDFIKVSAEGFLYKMALIIHYIFPRLGTLNHISNALLHGDPIKVELWMEGLHFTGSLVLLSGLVIWVFSKKEPLAEAS